MFGDDVELSKQLKDLTEATKVGKKLTKTSYRPDYNRIDSKCTSTITSCQQTFKLETAQPPILKRKSRGEEADQVGPNIPSSEVSMKTSQFQAGNLKNFIDVWHTATDDLDVLDWVAHCHIKFINNEPPIQTEMQRAIKFNGKESIIIDKEIEKLLAKGVLVHSQHEPGDSYLLSFYGLRKMRLIIE